MTNRNVFVTIALYVLIAPAQSNAEDVQTIMKSCNDCHGDSGVSQWSDVPTIAGLAEFVHADALYIYRDKERPCTESDYRMGDTSRPATNMCAVTADLSDAQIDAIAAAYAGLPYLAAKQEFDATQAAAGKAIHDTNCDRCHSKGGTDPEDEAGILGGQQQGYLRRAFEEYAAEARYQPDKMQEAMSGLSPADIETLLHYYASVQ